ncbi:MAG TPA: DUF4168 domain-containing protein [Leptolyngbyaceae cyanobacterium M65_K2018_010]|nr:DUF4168 domain-containing protein [Leptolyngbyaceae cyanobacterium M65_K2018_010]
MARPQSMNRWRRSLIMALLVSSTSLAVGAGPLQVSWPGFGRLTLGAVAWAQSLRVSPEEVMGYARSVLEMEALRLAAYEEVKALIANSNQDINAIDLRCTALSSLNQLPRNLRDGVRAIVVDYCNQASQIVQANGLSNNRFDAITAAYPQDATLAEQIRTALIQLQQQSQGVSRPAAAPAP